VSGFVKRSLLLAGLCAPVWAGGPAWWQQLMQGRTLSARFVQESDSAVFGKVQRKGRLNVAPGGKLRVAYEGGLLLVSDGQRIVQYDPDTRSAQRLELKRAVKEAPLLALLAEPRQIEQHYSISFQGERVKLTPKSNGLPVVEAEGKGAFPVRFRWTDPTGAAQELRLSDATASAPEAGAFRFTPPAGTRWSD
jgi:outer membrane lipoprotein-sorting protein